MIVVDEHLMQPELLDGFRWYRGSVVPLPELAGFTGAEDALIPALLRRRRGCVFVTNNAQDFWQKIDAEPTCCIVGFSLSPERVLEIPRLLQRLLKTPPFDTRAGRRGKVVRITARTEARAATADYYSRRSERSLYGRVRI